MRINKRYKLILFILVFLSIGSFFFLKIQAFVRPNIILITVDALRSDHLSCYGYKRNTSPNIDRIGQEGILFTQAISASSHTPPSIGTILTSNFPYVHSLVLWGDSIRKDITTIAELLKSEGFLTIFIGGNQNFSKGLHGINRGFDIFFEEESKVNLITNKALELINKSKNRPFFLWIHYMDAHSPYLPIPPYDRLFINDEFYDTKKSLPIVENFSDCYGYNGIPVFIATKKNGIDNPDYYVSQYDGAIRTIDTYIGMLINRLKMLKIYNRTLIIISADHGEMLGEHGYFFHHGCFLYEELIRIPLIINFPNLTHKIINTQINAHLDIAPTILDILKIRKAKTMIGSSLLPLILGKNRYPHKYVFVDEGVTKKCVRTDEWKLIYTNRSDKEEYELYNLKGDPQELNNLVSAEKEKFGFLKQKLDDYKQVGPQNKKSKASLDEATQERLRSLGYLQ